MLSPLIRQFVIAPLVFFIMMYVISFFVKIFEIDVSMYYILVAMISVPVFLYIVLGGM